MSSIVNVAAKILTDKDPRDVYFNKLRELDSLRLSFARHTEQIQQRAKEEKKKTAKKKPHKPVIVSGATNKTEILRLQRILKQKIAEISSEPEDPKHKQIRINDLCNKIASLDRIMIQIEQAEREAKQEQRTKKRKSRVDTQYLSSDDLTLKKNSRSLYDVTFGGAPVRAPIVQAMSVDITAGVEAVSAGAGQTAVNVEL